MINSMKQIGLIICLIVFLNISCKNQPEPVQKQPSQTAPAVSEKKPDPPPADRPAPAVQPPVQSNQGSPAPAFDPASISQTERDTAKTEIQQLIQRLNSIIRDKNYNAWVSYLSTGYFSIISSPEYLERISQSAVLVKQRIVLKSAHDYFIHVVVPSRANDRVDEIEFESQNRVKAYTVSSKGERLRLYDLEKTGNEWKIVN